MKVWQKAGLLVLLPGGIFISASYLLYKYIQKKRGGQANVIKDNSGDHIHD